MGTPFVRDGTWTSTYNTGDPALKRWAIIGTDVARVYPRTVRGSSFNPGPFYRRAIPPKIAQRFSAGAFNGIDISPVRDERRFQSNIRSLKSRLCFRSIISNS